MNLIVFTRAVRIKKNYLATGTAVLEKKEEENKLFK